MAKARKTWVYSPPKPAAPQVAAGVKADVQAKAADLVETVLKPQHIKPPPEDGNFNFLADIYTKWHRHWFYFCATYHCPGPTAIAPSFETKFARLEYVANNRFNLSFMRHTGDWIELHSDISLEQCFASITDDAFFYP